jgi:hypothetical protein
MNPYQCPACSATDSLRTSESRPWELPLRLFGLHPFRCQACSERFHRSWKIAPEILGHSVMARTDVPIKYASLAHPGPGPVPAIRGYTSVKVEALKAPASAPARDLSAAEEPARRRTWSWAGLPYTYKSFAILVMLHFVVGALEFSALGRAAMWVNLLTLVTLVGALLVFIDLYRVRRDYTEAAGGAAGLVLRWEGLFLALELGYGFFFGPGKFGPASAIALFREQAPWIWMTYAVLPIAGALGCSAYMLYYNQHEA